MAIPGLKVLDEILAGLPDNARLRREVEQLKEQIAALEKENADLKQLNEILKQASAALLTKKEDEMIRVGTAYFKKGPNGKAAGFAYCVHCWESNQKLSSLLHLLSTQYRCPACKTQVQCDYSWPASAR